MSDDFGLAFGLVARFSDVELERFVPFQNPFTGGILDAGRVDLSSDFEPGYGWNLGLLHRYNESFSWGFSYRSKVKVEYAGSARFTQISTGNPLLDAAIAQRIPFGIDLDVETEIEFPDMASLGFNFALSPNTRLETDVNWTGWSSFDTLPLVFVSVPPLSSSIEEGWDDVMNYRLGLRWMRPGGSEWRFGYVYDETPQPDQHVSPLLPDANRNGFTVGWGGQFAQTSLDVALMYLPFDERTTTVSADNFNGTYNTTAWLFGVTLGF
jgi:long-chain fatty acid transport protein